MRQSRSMQSQYDALMELKYINSPRQDIQAQLVYYDPFFAGSDRVGALDALGEYVDQVAR